MGRTVPTNLRKIALVERATPSDWWEIEQYSTRRPRRRERLYGVGLA